MDSDNPWDVQSLDDFLFYNCPECESKEADKSEFLKHALISHPRSKHLVNLLIVGGGDTSTKKEAVKIPLTKQVTTQVNTDRIVTPEFEHNLTESEVVEEESVQTQVKDEVGDDFSDIEATNDMDDNMEVYEDDSTICPLSDNDTEYTSIPSKTAKRAAEPQTMPSIQPKRTKVDHPSNLDHFSVAIAGGSAIKQEPDTEFVSRPLVQEDEVECQVCFKIVKWDEFRNHLKGVHRYDDNFDIDLLAEFPEELNDIINMPSGSCDRITKGYDGESRIVFASNDKSKNHFCLFCNKKQTSIMRHLRTQHRDKEEIQQLESLQGKAYHRRLNELKNLGNHYHNTKTIQQNYGVLIVGRKPDNPEAVKPQDYGPCKWCMRWMLKEDLRRHLKTCISFDNSNKESNTQLRKDSCILSGTAVPKKMSKEIVSEMRYFFQGHVQAWKKPVKNDIVPFLSVLDDKHPNHGYTWRDIRDKVWGLIRKEKIENGRNKHNHLNETV